ncbi:hypothetical protein PspLS_06310 [Pyricularia sp. CBS 133598]|nr:hypothetical protein PspLS_06310 [Pyricularia sp. CBS 133598]
MSHPDQAMARIRQPGPDDPLTKCQNKIHELGAELLRYVRRDDGTPAYFDCDDDTGARTVVIYDIPPKGETLTTVRVDLKRSEAKVKKLEEQLAAEQQTIAAQKLQITALTDFYDNIKATELKAVEPVVSLSSQPSSPLLDLNASSVTSSKSPPIKSKTTKDTHADGDSTPPNKTKTETPKPIAQDHPARNQKPASNLAGKKRSRHDDPDAEYSDSNDGDSPAAGDSEYSSTDPGDSSDSEAEGQKQKSNPSKPAAATVASANTPQRKKAKVEKPQPKAYTTSDGEVIRAGKFMFAHEVEAISIKTRPYLFEYPEGSGNIMALKCRSSSGCSMSGRSGWFVDNPLNEDYAIYHYMGSHTKDPTMDRIISAGGRRVVPDPDNEEEHTMSSEQFRKKLSNINKETNRIRLQSYKNWHVDPKRVETRLKSAKKRAKLAWQKRDRGPASA